MDAVMAATNDVNDEKEEEDEEPQFRELERMQSMTHEDIVEKIMQLRTTRHSDDDDDVNDDDDVWTGKTVRKGRGLREGARFFSCSCSSCCCSRDFFFFFFRESDCVASFQNAIGGKDASSFSSVRELQISDTPSSKLTIVSLTTPSRTDTRPKR